MLSALWLAPIVLFLVHGYSNPESSPLDLLYFGLTALFWIGHRLSSTYLAYCTEAYRPLLREQPIRFVMLPIVVTTGCFALFLPADSALPWTREERLIASRGIDFFPALCFISAIHPFFSSGMRLKSFSYALSRLSWEFHYRIFFYERSGSDST